MSNLQTKQEVDKLEVENTENKRQPDNSYTRDINGTKYIIREYLNGKETINDIMTRRIIRDLDPTIPTSN